MKNILYTMGLILLLASCSDDYTNWANPQSNAEEAAKTVSLTVSPAAAIDFANVTTDSVQLFIPKVTTTDQATNSYKAVLYNADKTSSSTITASESGYVLASELETDINTLYGRRPTARTVNMDISSYTISNGQSIKNAGSTTATITPVAPEIESKYYITGGINGWDNTNTTYEVVNGGGDPYDDPIFTISIPASAVGTGFEFKLTPISGVGGDWSKCITAAIDGTEGKLASNNVGANLKITAVDGAKLYRLTFNLLDQTWSVKALSFNQYAYEIGDESGWSTTHTLYGANFDGKYEGFYYLNGSFKFRPNADNWDNDYEYVSEGKLTQDGSNNIPDPGAGFYMINLNEANLTYSLTRINYISIIGSVNGNWDKDTDLTYNTETGAWETTATLTTGEMKFRMNHDWNISWGGANNDGTNFGNLTNNGGANLQVTSAGTYKIQLFISYEGNNKVVMTTASAKKARR